MTSFDPKTADRFLGDLAERVHSLRRNLERNPLDSYALRLAAWDSTTEMHLLVDQVEALMLGGLDQVGWRDPSAAAERSKVLGRRKVQADL